MEVWMKWLATVTLPILTYLLIYMRKGRESMKKAIWKDQTRFEEQSIDTIESAKKMKSYKSDSLMSYLYEDAQTLLDCMKRGARETFDGNCLGRIVNGQMEWITYAKVLERIRHFGDGLLQLNQLPKCHVAIFAINRPEYIIAEYGCYCHSMIVSPIYHTFSASVCTYIVNQAEIEVVIVDSLDRFQALISQATSFTHLKFIVTMEPIPQSYISKAKNFKFEVLTMEEVEALGQSHPSEKPAYPTGSDTALICYTSGTTGYPKGVILSHENFVASSSGLLHSMFEYYINRKDTYFSYLPLAHIMERCGQAAVYMNGGRVGFYSGNLLRLLDDIKIVKPTIFITVPRLLNKIYDKLYETVRGSMLKQWLLAKAIEAKQEEHDRQQFNRNTIWDKLVCNKLRASLGGNVRMLALGSALVDPKVARVIRNLLGCVLVNGYGQTECCAFTLSFPLDKRTDTVGPPVASVMIRLKDIPEMGYYADKGKGEVCVKGTTVTKLGYFKNEAETKKLFDEDGWLLTGDVGQWTPQGTIKLIDRRKNFFKLSQGEYIPVEKLEAAYLQSSFVSQLYVYGDSSRSYLVAIIIPDKEYLEFWRLKNGIKGSFHELCNNKQLKQAIIDDLKAIAIKQDFIKLEYVKQIHLHTEPFSLENGLLTPTMKVKRHSLRKHFENTIEQLYKLPL